MKVLIKCDVCGASFWISLGVAECAGRPVDLSDCCTHIREGGEVALVNWEEHP